MTDERRPDETPIQNPIDNPIDSPSNPSPEANQPPEPKPHSVPKQKKEAPAWLQAIGGFFKALFVTPWALMQKVFLRIAGGKKMVEEAEKQLVEDLKEQKVRKAESERASFLEREINDLLKERLQDPAYTSDGLYITNVSINPNITGDDSILYSISVTCKNGDKDSGEYQIHMSRDGQLLYNAIVPPELQLQLQELLKSASLTAGDPQVGDYEEPSEYEPAPAPNPDALIEAHTVSNQDGRVDITVTRSKNNADIDLIYEAKDSSGNLVKLQRQCKATLVDGHIRIDNLPQSVASNAMVSQTIYQAFQPFIQHDFTEQAKKGISPELRHKDTLEKAFVSLCLSVGSNHTADIQNLTKSTSMFIIPGVNGMATVINENISPENKRQDLIHLNAYQLDVTNPQNYQFQQTPLYEQDNTTGEYHPKMVPKKDENNNVITKKDENGKEIIDQTTGKPQIEEVQAIGTKVTHQIIQQDLFERAWNAELAKWYYAATNTGVMTTKRNEQGQATHQFLAFGDKQKIDDTGDPSFVTCVKAVTQAEGFELQSESHLNHAQLQEFANMLHRDDNPTTFSTETRSAAAKVLSQAAQYKQQGEDFTRYFVMGDTVMSYDGSTLTMQRPGDKQPFMYAADKLDADIIETAYIDYNAQTRDEHEQPSNDEVEPDL